MNANKTNQSIILDNLGEVFATYLLPTVCVMGAILNLGVLVLILWNPGKSGRTPPLFTYLTALCIFDFIIPAVQLLLIVLEASRSSVMTQLTLGLYPLLMAANCASIWTIVSIAIQRFFAICHPFLLRNSEVLRSHRTIVLLLSLIAVSLNVPRFWENKIVVHRYNDSLSDWKVEYDQTVERGILDPSNNRVYCIVMEGFIYSFLVFLVPFLTTLFLSGRVMNEMRKSNQMVEENMRLTKGHSEKKSQRRKEKFRRFFMVLVVVAVFFGCRTLSMALRWVKIFRSDFGRNSLDNFLRIFSNFLVSLNCFLNPLIYMIFTHQFRQLLSRSRLNYQNSSSASVIAVTEV